MATVLDPRFKNVHFKEPRALADALSSIKEMMKKENDHQPEKNASEQIQEKDASDFWNHHKTLLDNKSRQPKHYEVHEEELRSYLNYSLAPLSSDPLEEWSKMKAVYPQLYKLALMFFSVVATSVPAERLFSQAGFTVNQSRNRLLGKRINKLVFLSTVAENDWFQ